MIELFTQLAIGFTIALSGVLLPGPLMAFTTASTLDHGPTAGPYAALGHVSVELTLLVLAGLGLHALLGGGLFLIVTGNVGGILLVVFGLSLIRGLFTKGNQSPSISGDYHPALGGVLFSSLLNPSVLLWWMTVGLATFTHSYGQAGIVGAGFWLAGHFLADFGWYTGLSYSVHKGKNFIGGSFYRGLILVCGSAMVVFGVRFSVKYLPKLIP